MGSSNLTLIDVISSDVSGVSHEVLFIFSWIVYGVVCQIINIFGLVTNIINIICFVKQGFDDSINVSLVGLSVSDIGCLTTAILTNLCYTPAVTSADLSFDPMEVNYLASGIPHLTFSRVTSWITAIITLERCLCVIAPLKIKAIFTPRRTSVLIVCVFILFFSSLVPVYIVNRLDMKFSFVKNKTIYGLVYTEDKEKVEMITFTICNFILPFVAFIIIVTCTTILVLKLKSATKWRIKSAEKSQSETISTRNQKVARMVVMISSLFIVCFVPICLSMLAVAFEPELLLFTGKYFAITQIIGGLDVVLESVNSSMNIFIYYHMSSRYRDVFSNLFWTNQMTKLIC